jgi:hypothetical protein
MNTWQSPLLLAALVVSTACGQPRTPQQAVGDIGAPNAEVRLKAARDIEDGARKSKGLPPDIVEALLKQVVVENDFKTHAAELIALGYTGDARVKPLLDEYAKTNDPQQRKYASRALKKFAAKTGAVPENFEFPDDWPYGTAGYPPSLPKQ